MAGVNAECRGIRCFEIERSELRRGSVLFGGPIRRPAAVLLLWWSLVRGAFLNLAYHDLPYYMMVIVIAVYRRLVKEASPNRLPVDSTVAAPIAVPDRKAASRPLT